MVVWVRKNIGMIVSFLGFFLLLAITFGNIVDVFTPQYWRNVVNNIASIGILSVSLTFIQATIKQGICEQALSSGLNQPLTKTKFWEHKEILKNNESKFAFVPYFLDSRNLRDTARRKREFLVNNRFPSEQSLFASKNKKLIKKYNSIATKIRLQDIKWTSTTVVVDKLGRIETLQKYRRKRAIKGAGTGALAMLFMTLIARELFGGVDDTPLWVNIFRIITYLVTISVTVLFPAIKDYEKGAFGTPNDLDEINSIWREFENWRIPADVLAEVERNQIPIESKEAATTHEQENENSADSGAAIQEEPKEIQAA